MSINGLLNQSVTVELNTSAVGKHGESSFSTGVEYQARFQKTTKSIVNKEGDRIPINGIVFLPADAVITNGSRLTYGSDIYRVMSNEPVPGANGVTHHVELLVQSWSFGT